jgi:hypothetical protein
LRAAANAVILSLSLKKNPGAGAWDNKNTKSRMRLKRKNPRVMMRSLFEQSYLHVFPSSDNT